MPTKSSSVTLLPAQLDLQLYAGDTLELRFVFTDAGGGTVDMTGTWSAQVRGKADDPDPPLESFAVDVSDAVDGVIVATLTGMQTAALLPTCVWDIQQVVAGLVRTTHRGTITLTGDVTRP